MSEPRPDEVSSWTINQVVFEFCHNDRPRWVSAGLPDIPAKDQLEEAFKSNHVDGSLLLELSLEDLKNELNIRSLGQRKAIEKAIRFLRGEPQPSATPAPFSIGDRARRTENWIPTPDNSRFSFNQASPAWETASPFPGRPSAEPSLFGDSPGVPSRELPPPPASSQRFVPHPNLNSALYATSAARAVRASFPPGNRVDAVLVASQAKPVSEPVQPRNINSPALYNESPVKTEIALDQSGGSGGLLDNLEAHVLGDLQSPLNVDQSSTSRDVPALTPNTQAPEPKQKRRIAPTLVEPVRANDPSHQVLQSANGNTYLKSEPLSMQETFYGDGSDDGERFSIVGPVQHPGQAAVVANRTKKFLLSKPINVPGLAYSALARIPYRPRSCVGPSKVFFTLFAQNASPSFQLLDDWPALLQQVDSTKVAQKGGDVVRSEEAVSPFEVEPHGQENDDGATDLGDFAYLLEKYPVAEDDGADLLPVYGESGDENDFDDDTWAEINDEKEEKQTKSSFLSREEAIAAIDQAIEELRAKWQTDRLPKVQSKAYRLWTKVAKARRRQDVIEAQYSTRNRKLAYLEKMKDHILKDRWTSTDQIKKQCESLEETLSQVLEAEHLLDVLHQNKAPIKPPPRQLKRASVKPILQDDEEILESESEPDLELPVDNFVVGDDGDLAMADNPADQDFNPQLPIVSRPVLSPGISTPNQDAAEQAPSNPPLRLHQDRLQVPEPESLETPGHDADVSDSDGDIDGDEDEDQILRSTDKRRSANHLLPQEPVNSDDWSPSTGLPFDSDDENSDMDAPRRLPQTEYKSLGKRAESPIVLLSSDPARPEDSSSGPEYTVETPPLNTPDSDDKQHRKMRPVVVLKVGRRRSSELRKSEPDDDRARRFSVLRSALDACEQKVRHDLRDFVSRIGRQKMSKGTRLSYILEEGVKALWTEPADDGGIGDFNVKGLADDENETTHWMTLLFVSYIVGKDCIGGDDYSVAIVNRAFEERLTHMSAFQSDLFAALGLVVDHGLVDTQVKIEKGQKGKKPKSLKRKRVIASSDDDLEGTGFDETDDTGRSSDVEIIVPKTPHSKKKKVAQSQEVRETQKDDQQRVREQAQRRELLAKKLQKFGESGANIPPINAEEPMIMLDRHIAARVKPHQVNGIQFLWREIVSDPKHQGCLLAHTMGLGKTMQVISLLVTVAQARSSPDVGVVNQLPQHIQDNDKTLVLCPPSLLDNWYDELLMWSPPDQPDLLGLIIKISAARSDDSRKAMRRWALRGGVLIMSYEAFRSLLMPGKTKIDHQKQVEEYEKLLLGTPSIVVADEAHKFKNDKSKISMVTKRFETNSRIALTGSPLNNHLEEYHTMVEWIAPNYLGNMAQFRSNYIDPITAGLYADSSAYERRICLRKLHVLKKDLEPKVNRADITAIRNDMPPKTEYIVTIPLADLQKKAYDLYVAALLKNAENGAARTSLFKWLNKLMILVNHPSCFIKLFDKYEELRQQRDGYESSTDAEKQTAQQARQELSNMETYDPLNVDKVTKFDAQSMKLAVDVFNNELLFNTHEEARLSHRTDIARRILQKAVSVGDKTLVFSQSIPTLDYLEKNLGDVDPNLMRIDGGTAMAKRQKMTKDFNQNQSVGEDAKIILISTKAGGLGLNLQGANRVIIFDSGFNPMWEEQAVGRAYRLGQTAPVFVYRFKCGGTFEEPIYNKALFKTQLFQRVVDKKNPTRAAFSTVQQYLFLSKDVKRRDFSSFVGRDPDVLDQVLNEVDYVHNIELTETFQKDDGEKLTEEDLKQANAEYEDELLRRSHPDLWHKKQQQLLNPHRPMVAAGPSGGTAPGWGAGPPGAHGVGARLGERGTGKRMANTKLVTSKEVQLSQERNMMEQLNEFSSEDNTKSDEAREILTQVYKGRDHYGRPLSESRAQPPQFDGANDSDSSGSDSVNIEQITKPKGKGKPQEGCTNQ